jgi:putative heme transporter
MDSINEQRRPTGRPQPRDNPRPVSPPRQGGDDVQQAVPRTLRVGAAIGWRLLVVAAALYVIGTAVAYLAALVVPVAIALLLAALLAPAVGYLVQRRVSHAVATALVLVGGLAGLGGILTFVIITFINGLPALLAQLSTSIDAGAAWLTEGPLQLSPQQLSAVRDQLLATLSANQASITAGALTTAATVGQTLTEILLVLFTLIFFLHGGAGIWRFLLRAAPSTVRYRVDVAGRRSLAALVAYVRATAAVAVVDAVGIGIALIVLGVPLAVPLAALVFLSAFVPIIGSVLAGGVAVLIALVAVGWVSALVLLGVVVAVMQLESHILQPLLLGRAVQLHPLAVVLVIAAGLLTGGIAGALLAVPLLAVLNSAVRSLLSDADHHIDPVDVDPGEPEQSAPDPAGLTTATQPTAAAPGSELKPADARSKRRARNHLRLSPRLQPNTPADPR